MSFGNGQHATVLAISLAAVLVACRAVAAEPEEELKAATVLSFLRYSDWPSQPPGANMLTVGVVGRTSSARVLHRVLDGKLANRRTIRGTELKTVADSRCCDVIFFATDKHDVIRQGLSVTRGTPVLTIGEIDRFLDAGGVVNLFLSDGRISFEVDIDALARSGVTVSSTLLRFGQVRRRQAE